MPTQKSSAALVAVIMGSASDWETMRRSVELLDELGVPNESHVLSAHRTPDATADFARKAADRGLRVIIAGAGAAAHLAGVIAGYTWLPVLGVPIPSSQLQGLDSLLSTARSEETRLNSSHVSISYAVFCLKKKNTLSFSSLASSCRSTKPVHPKRSAAFSCANVTPQNSRYFSVTARAAGKDVTCVSGRDGLI